MKDSSDKVRYIKPVAIALSLLVLFALFGLGRGVRADGELNPSKVVLHFLYEEDRSITGDMPASYISSYQIKTDGLSGTPSFKVVSGMSVSVSRSGLVTILNFGTDTDVRYSPGTSVVRVTCGNYTQDIVFEVIGYEQEYVDNRINNVLSEIIRNDMTELEKLKAITKWVAENTDYGNYSSYTSMMLYECGDCWGSTNTIIEMCGRVGLEAGVRLANNEPGAGSGHRNAIVLCDGKYYIAEAGFTGTRPRTYSVFEEALGFSRWVGNVIYQYDGFDTDVVVPSSIKGTEITQFGKNGIPALYRTTIQSIYFPSTIQTIDDGIFRSLPALKIIVDPDNPNYVVDNEVLYTKDKTKIIYTPSTLTSLTISSNTTEIAWDGLSNLTLDKLVIPDSVRTIGKAALKNSIISNIEIEEGLESIGEEAFAYVKTPKIVLPSTVKTLGAKAFIYSKTDSVIVNASVDEIPEEAFYLSQTKKIELPEGIKKIGKRAFYQCSALKTMSIPTSVTEIGSEAFTGCANLHIYYAGSEEDWNKIKFDSELYSKVTVHFNSVRVTGIDLGDSEITLASKGETLTPEAQVIPSNASNKDITYTSDDTSIVKIEDNKLVAGNEGTCNVTATSVDGGFTATYKVTVRYTRYALTIEGGEIYDPSSNSSMTSMEFLKNQIVVIRKGQNAQEGFTFVKWDLDDDIEITNNVTPSSALIIVKLPARDVTIKAIYEPIPMDSIYINYPKLVMCEGEEMDLKASIYPATAYDKSIVWSSSNENAVTVDDEGHLKAVGLGKSNIAAASVDGSVSSSKITIKVGDHYWEETKHVSATYDEEGKITYKCSNCGKKKTEVLPKLDPGKFSEDPGHLFSWKKISGKWYFVSSWGSKAVGLWKISGKVYYFSSTGVMKTGWQTIAGNKYCFDSKGIMKTGWQTISKKKYYFSKKGVMATGFKTISSKIYYFSKDGVFKTGWKTVSKKKYYFTTKGAKTGWQTISKKKYYFDKTGVMATGSTKISGKYYLFGTDGVLAKSGWRQDAKGRYFYVKKTGETTNGWKTISGKKYYFSKSGIMATGLKQVDGKTYLFSSKGLIRTGWQTVDGNTYYFTSKGAKTGWYEKDGYKYYFDEDGVMATGLTTIGDEQYNFDENGHLLAVETVTIPEE